MSCEYVSKHCSCHQVTGIKANRQRCIIFQCWHCYPSNIHRNSRKSLCVHVSRHRPSATPHSITQHGPSTEHGTSLTTPSNCSLDSRIGSLFPHQTERQKPSAGITCTSAKYVRWEKVRPSSRGVMDRHGGIGIMRRVEWKSAICAMCGRWAGGDGGLWVDGSVKWSGSALDCW